MTSNVRRKLHHRLNTSIQLPASPHVRFLSDDSVIFRDGLDQQNAPFARWLDDFVFDGGWQRVQACARWQTATKALESAGAITMACTCGCGTFPANASSLCPVKLAPGSRAPKTPTDHARRYAETGLR